MVSRSNNRESFIQVTAELGEFNMIRTEQTFKFQQPNESPYPVYDPPVPDEPIPDPVPLPDPNPDPIPDPNPFPDPPEPIPAFPPDVTF